MPRTRRTAAQTRDAMLDAAQTVLVARGPDAVRLDDVAALVGVSRQAVLHHFGSRAGLVRAVAERAWVGLFSELRGMAEAGVDDPDALIDRVDDVVRRRGNARLGAWLILSGEGLPDTVFDGVLTGLAPDQDAAFQRMAIGAAMFGDAVFGARLRQALGLGDSEEEREKFRKWLVARLVRR
jgi:AcrR family transcriptional regulator